MESLQELEYYKKHQLENENIGSPYYRGNILDKDNLAQITPAEAQPKKDIFKIIFYFFKKKIKRIIN